MSALLFSLFVGAGLAMVVTGILLRSRERDESLAALLDLPYGDHDVDVTEVTERQGAGVAEGAVEFAGTLMGRMDARGSFAASLERARIPVRPGEYAIIAASAAVVAAILAGGITTQPILGAAAAVATFIVAAMVPRVRIARRKKQIVRQLPDALSLIASSLSAGHTFLRSVQMMCEEADPPLAEEFARVVAETRLGDPLVDALARMADRLQIPDVAWVVQAIRIQQSVGGKLGELLHTLANFMRSREEVRREVDVLTAEGRISAYILGAMPLFLLVAMQVLSPGYSAPLFSGWGLAVLALTGCSVATGVVVILRMVKIEV